ncbi:hypothetical protein AB0A69_27520 [Streptomyces sp. NPDC045431]|uniref:hypothetical protein n=1 Tax=Streptomyces sp. NPDC045431 TaxID=3155613 RepID=UPI0033FD32AB
MLVLRQITTCTEPSTVVIERRVRARDRSVDYRLEVCQRHRWLPSNWIGRRSTDGAGGQCGTVTDYRPYAQIVPFPWLLADWLTATVAGSCTRAAPPPRRCVQVQRLLRPPCCRSAFRRTVAPAPPVSPHRARPRVQAGRRAAEMPRRLPPAACRLPPAACRRLGVRGRLRGVLVMSPEGFWLTGFPRLW